MAREPWQYLPTDVLDQQQRDETAREWADEQRRQLAQQWADAQRAAAEPYRARLTGFTESGGVEAYAPPASPEALQGGQSAGSAPVADSSSLPAAGGLPSASPSVGPLQVAQLTPPDWTGGYGGAPAVQSSQGSDTAVAPPAPYETLRAPSSGSPATALRDYVQEHVDNPDRPLYPVPEGWNPVTLRDVGNTLHTLGNAEPPLKAIPAVAGLMGAGIKIVGQAGEQGPKIGKAFRNLESALARVPETDTAFVKTIRPETTPGAQTAEMQRWASALGKPELAPVGLRAQRLGDQIVVTARALSGGTADLARTIVHELGHSIYDNLPEAIQAEWDATVHPGGRDVFAFARQAEKAGEWNVSSLAADSPAEDFAESWRAFRGFAAQGDRALSGTRRRILGQVDDWLRARGDTTAPMGAVAGFSQDEQGNVTFDPGRAALGIVGMGAVNTVRAARAGTSVLHPPRSAGFEQLWNRARNVIAHQGPAGEELAQRIYQARELGEGMAGEWVSQLATLRGLPKQLMDNFVDVAEGKAAPVNQTVAKAAQEWDAVRTAVYNEAKAAGLDIGHLADYFPHRYDPNVFQGADNWGKAVQHLVASGQANTVAQAEQILYRVRDALHGKAGNLEIERLVNLPDYQRTKEAVLGYVESAAKRIGEAQQLGPSSEIATGLITKIGQQGGDTGAVKNLLQISLGTKEYGQIADQISRVGRAYSTLTKLGLGAITNASQSLNTATVTGVVRTLTHAPEAALSQEAKDFALRIGVTLDGVINDLREGGGFAGKVGKIGAPGFGTVEKFNRTLAAVAGRDYAREMAQKAAAGEQGAVAALQKLGLLPQTVIARGGTLSPAEEAQAARNIVERTQFKVDPQDLPGWTDSPMGKLVSQFRTFSYNQSAFMGREVLQPALKGDVRPMVRFLLLGLPVGAAEVELQNLLRNRPSEEEPNKRILQYVTRVGAFGVLGDLITGFLPPNTKYLPGERYALQAASTVAGPTPGTVLEGLGSIPSALQGDPTALERFALKQIPVVGPTIKNTVLPYKPGGRAGLKTTGRDAIDQYLNRVGPGQSHRTAVESYLSGAGR